MENVNVNTPHGKGILQEVYITELGMLMGKVFFPKEGIFINYQINKDLNLNSNLED